MSLIYPTLAILCFLLAFSLLQSRLRYLNRYPENYDKSYDGHEVFLIHLFGIIRFYTKKVKNVLKVMYQNLLHAWVQIIEKISSASDRVYAKSRDKFVEEIVKDKKSIPHFWNHLKRYKKEKDEEKENEEGNSVVD